MHILHNNLECFAIRVNPIHQLPFHSRLSQFIAEYLLISLLAQEPWIAFGHGEIHVLSFRLFDEIDAHATEIGETHGGGITRFDR